MLDNESLYFIDGEDLEFPAVSLSSAVVTVNASCADSDGDGQLDTDDTDDDGDGFGDAVEQHMTTDHLEPCPTGAGHDAWPPDHNSDTDSDIGDLVASFSGVILNPPAYDPRSDPNMDGAVNIGDLVGLYGGGKILTECLRLSLVNDTGGAVDGVVIEWSSPVHAVFSASDSDAAGWSERALSGGGLVVDLARPHAEGDLANGGQLDTVLWRSLGEASQPLNCTWTLAGVDVGQC